MTTRPDKIPSWATSGTTTDPGSGLQASGYVADDVPAAAHYNWLQNRNAQWLDFYYQVMLPQIHAYTLAESSGLTTYLATSSLTRDILRDDTNNKVYLTSNENLVLDQMNLYESTDGGVSWSNRSPVGLSAASNQNASRVTFGPSNNLWYIAKQLPKFGSRADSATLASASNSLTNPVTRGLCYDSSLGLFIATTTGSTAQSIETTTDPNSAAWALRTTTAVNRLNDVATDGAGQLLAVGQTGVAFSSTNGTTWSAETSGVSENFTKIEYNATLGFVVQSTADTYVTADGSSWSTLRADTSNFTIVGDWIVFLTTAGTLEYRLVADSTFNRILTGASIVPAIGAFLGTSDDDRLLIGTGDFVAYTAELP